VWTFSIHCTLSAAVWIPVHFSRQRFPVPLANAIIYCKEINRDGEYYSSLGNRKTPAIGCEGDNGTEASYYALSSN
jgi:hypothetical protein